MILNTNTQSLFTRRTLSNQSAKEANLTARLSSGLRINSAGDDAAGLAISERLTSQINGSSQAKRNVNDGISVAQTAEGALNSAGDILQRIRVLALQSANGTNSTSDRTALQAEVDELISEFDRIGKETEFNGRKLLDGSSLTTNLHVGANRHQSLFMMVQSTRASDIYNYVLTSDVLSTASMAAAQTATSDGSLNQKNRLQVQNLTLNTRGQTGVAVLQAGISAQETASRINTALSKKQGLVSARAETYATLALTGTESGTLDFKINGVSIQSFSKQVNSDVNDIILAINNASGVTGVVASTYSLTGGGNGILLHASQGEDIKISEMNVSLSSGAVGTVSVQGGYDAGGGVFGSIGAAVSLTAGGSGASRNTTVGGRVLLSNDVAFTVGHSATGSTGGLFAYLPTTLVPCSKGTSVNAISVMNVSDSTKTLDIVDAALGRINLYRGVLGGSQNRLEFTKDNLSQSVEALSAARSRMRDADFANEMSDLMKIQVTQKAGMAMLTQANASSRRVLDLLG